MEQARHTLFDIAMEKIESLDACFHKYDEFVQQVRTKTDKNAHEVCTAIGRIINEQEDIRKIVEDLAQCMDNLRDGTYPSDGPPEADAQNTGVAMQLELRDLKTKVLRLTEQTTEHAAQIGFLPIMSERVDLAEKQILRWRRRLPDLTDDEEQEPIVTAVEVQEQLDHFQERTRNKVHDVSDQPTIKLHGGTISWYLVWPVDCLGADSSVSENYLSYRGQCITSPC